jgi:phospholipid/cholesterol/gamma-HCH transport system substrate-binding protein
VNTEAKVGVFVVAAAALLATTLYFVRTTQTVRGQVPFNTYFHDAGGLTPDASVLFGGIKVGQITAVHPAAEDPTRIEVAFQVTSSTPMNRESIARVGTVTLMGTPSLQITTGSGQALRLAPGDTVRSEEAVGLNEITRQVGTLAQSANALLGDLREEIPAIAGKLHAVLTNVEQITGADNRQQLRTVLARTSALMNHADELVVAARPLVSNIDRTVSNVNGTVDALREPLVDDMAGLRQTLDDARTLIAGFQDVVNTNHEDIAETMRALRATTENLQSFSEQLKQRPWSLVRTAQPGDRKVPR